MNLYHQLMENPLFFKWIYYPSPEINTYWEHYLEQHAEEAKVILKFKEGFEKQLSYKDQRLTEKEKQDLANRIIRQLEIKDQKSKHRKLIRLVMRYAAVAILFMVIGAGVSYIYTQRHIFNHFSHVPPPSPMNMNIQEPTLILDDKEEIALNKGESTIEYSDKGDIIIDHQKVKDEESSDQVKMNTLVIPYGSRSTVLLADGTKVWLNAGSRLIYPSRFTNKKREVFLVGEAFFDVTKNETQPFQVRTPDIEVEVLGTRFNISAYPDENIVQTVLTEGAVKQRWINDGIFNYSTELKPGQLLLANKQAKEVAVHTVNTDYYTSWKEGYLTFDNSDLSRVVKKLERYYNIRFHYDDPMNGAIKISGKLDVTGEKEIVFSYMNSLTGLNFTKINETYYMIK